MQTLEIILPVAVVVVAVVVVVGVVDGAAIHRRLCISVTMNSERQMTKNSALITLHVICL